MKKEIINWNYLLFITIIGLLSLSGCKKDEIQLPQLKTVAINNITVKTADGGGIIVFDGGGVITACGLCWNIAPNPIIDNYKTTDTLQNDGFTSHLNNLMPDTTYYVRAYAVNSAGIAYGDEVSFRTLKITMPVVTTKDTSEVTYNSFKIEAVLTSNGGSEISACGFCWNLEHNPTINNYKTIDTLQNNRFNSYLKNLISDTTYYVRAYAVNNAGIAYGNEVACHTLKKALPVVTTKNASEITSGSFKIDAAITSRGDGEISACGFCWSLFDNPTIDGNKISEAIIQDNFEDSIEGLIPDTTYYTRAYVTNETGTYYGNTIKVKTQAVAELSDPTIKASTFSLTASENIITDYGTDITERGFCWGTNDNPTKDDSYMAIDKGSGSYSYKIDNLNSSTTYYVRAYAQNKYGIIYGNSITTKTLDETGTVTDICGNTYKYITIGKQTWMASDLKTTKYRNGDNIRNYVSLTSTVGTVGTIHRANPDFGNFYNWYAVTDSRNIAPEGWHVATEEDWTQLINFLGGNAIAGGKLKSQHEWYEPNATTDEFGFSALPTGYRYATGGIVTAGYSKGYWWTTTSVTDTTANDVFMYYGDTQTRKLISDKRCGNAVRCVRD